MSEYTPGPWRVSDGDSFSGGSDVSEPPEYEYIVLAERKTPSAIASFWDFDWGDEAQANARLIAAAPELLEAAQAAVAALSQNAVFPADIAAAKKWLGDAIAKARGEQ